MTFIGIDGCKAGWFVVGIDNIGHVFYHLLPNIRAIWELYSGARTILIDIPIGLPESGQRRCDIEAKRMLRRRHASVFPVPVRQAVYQQSYQKACMINQQLTGRKISIQTWNILPKVREVDRFIRSEESALGIIRESHPELCFQAFARGQELQFSKKSKQGIRERYTLLKTLNRDTATIFDQAMNRFKRNELSADDILDASVLAITARLPVNSLATLPEKPERDKHGLPMEIVSPALSG